MHNGFLKINNEKMSKSLGNFFTVRDIGKHYELEVLRFFMLSSHYRSPINFSDELMESSKTGLERIRTCASNIEYLYGNAKNENITDEEKEQLKEADAFIVKFENAMDDDCNTADAISSLFELVKLANVSVNENSSKEFLEGLKNRILTITNVLGISAIKEEKTLDSDIEELINKRQEARKNKDFALADKIRDDLLNMGIILEDTREGVKWKRK